MSIIHSLPGSAAQSAFRLEKICAEATQAGIQIGKLTTRYWYFLELDAELDVEAQLKLDQLLDSNKDQADHASASCLLVTPRPGTISPWSSKASEILKSCGISGLKRIERGIAYYFECREGFAGVNVQSLLPLLHDRMTEAVVTSIKAAAALFQHVPPRALATIDVSHGGRAALVQANAALGLALSGEELDYLLDNFTRLRRDPTDVELMMFAQANSEHCRHKIFNASWVIDGEPRDKTLFGMIRAGAAIINPWTA